MLPIERTRKAATIATGPRAPEGLSIALLHPTYWPEVRRGAERLVHDLGQGLLAAGATPTLITSHRGRSRVDLERGMPVVRNRRLPEGAIRPFGYHESVGHLPLLARRLANGHFAVAHAFHPVDAVAAARWARRSRRPSVFTITGIPQRDVVEGRLWRRRAWKRAVGQSDAVVVLSEAAREALAWLGVEVDVIPPGVDLTAFRRTAERHPDPTVFCPAAIEDDRKRVGLVVEAFSRLRARLPRSRLLLAERRDHPTGEILGRDGVELVDVDSTEALVRAYSEAWTTVLASIDEAFGLVLLESLACGTPVVGSGDGGARELISERAVGRLFAGDDAGRLAEEISATLELASDPRTPAACRGRAEAFGVEGCVSAHLELYGRLLAR